MHILVKIGYKKPIFLCLYINSLQTFFKKMQNKFAGIKNMLYLCTAKQKKYGIKGEGAKAPAY